MHDSKFKYYVVGCLTLCFAIACNSFSSIAETAGVESQGKIVVGSDIVFDSSDLESIENSIDTLSNDLISDIYVGADGKLHKIQGGADSVLPFSSFGNLKRNTNYSLSWSFPQNTFTFNQDMDNAIVIIPDVSGRGDNEFLVSTTITFRVIQQSLPFLIYHLSDVKKGDTFKIQIGVKDKNAYQITSGNLLYQLVISD